jgi:GntR family transcriptional regulator
MGEPLFYEHVNFVDGEGRPLLIGKQYIVGSLFVFSI